VKRKEKLCSHAFVAVSATTSPGSTRTSTSATSRESISSVSPKRPGTLTETAVTFVVVLLSKTKRFS